MDPITLLVSALALGAAAGLHKTAEQAVQDAYAGLKALLARKFPQADVTTLEKDPADENLQKYVGKKLQSERADQDVEVMQQAAAVHAAAARASDLAQIVGVRIVDVEAANIVVERVRSTGSGVEISESRATGDLRVRDVDAGSGTTDPNA